ncbi:unnamed protein product [Protopolystoma xenopodis]|uniref:PDZ domain-containing protein n=1 Tax=Protopolystoma xenopodis TaxID=117903 RepID=A0A3S4ZVK6_9PLAT|nr:unnamed protein product [Protopolystoma xenopodis]
MGTFRSHHHLQIQLGMIQANDRILSVDGQANDNFEKTLELMKNSKTGVRLKIARMVPVLPTTSLSTSNNSPDPASRQPQVNSETASPAPLQPSHKPASGAYNPQAEAIESLGAGRPEDISRNRKTPLVPGVETVIDLVKKPGKDLGFSIVGGQDTVLVGLFYFSLLFFYF